MIRHLVSGHIWEHFGWVVDWNMQLIWHADGFLLRYVKLRLESNCCITEQLGGNATRPLPRTRAHVPAIALCRCDWQKQGAVCHLSYPDITANFTRPVQGAHACDISKIRIFSYISILRVVKNVFLMYSDVLAKGQMTSWGREDKDRQHIRHHTQNTHPETS